MGMSLAIQNPLEFDLEVVVEAAEQPLRLPIQEAGTTVTHNSDALEMAQMTTSAL